MNVNDAVTADESDRQFVRWALASLGVAVTELDRDHSKIDVPAIHQAFFRGASVAQLEFNGSTPSAAAAPQATSSGTSAVSPPIDAPCIPIDEAFLNWLVAELRSAATVPYAVPALPPVRVHEISSTLFKAYTVEGGSVHLGGCTLEQRPVLRQSWVQVDSAGQSRMTHRFTAVEGVPFPDAEVAALGLNSMRMPVESLPKLAPNDVRAWCDAADQNSAGDEIETLTGEPLASIVWCQFAAGKIEYVVGNATAAVAFSGWARELAEGLVEPPAFQCPVTKIQSHAITATDDGQITVNDAVKVCALSGRRVLVSELEVCAETGQAVLPEYLVTCPVSGSRVVESAMEPCGTCQQIVSSACVVQGICGACRALVAIRKDDPRMARVLGEYPRLDRWSHWRIGETSTAYVLVAAGFIKRVLVVVNKESLEVLRLATRNRFSPHWLEPPSTERQELLG